MLVALLTILFLGGGGGSAVLDSIADSPAVVPELLQGDQRREEVLETMDAIEDLGKQQSKAWQDVLKQMKSLLSDRETSTDVIDFLGSADDQQLREINDTTLDHRFALREQLSRDEWEQVFQRTVTDE